MLGQRPAVLGLLATLVVAGETGCAGYTPPEQIELPSEPLAAPTAASFLLGPNDVVRAHVHGHPELSTPENTTNHGTRIDPDGTLSLPLVGALPVEGLTLAEARVLVRDAYAEYLQDPKLDLSIVEYASRRFYLYGEVNAPGAYVLDRELTVYQALALGEGFTPGAERDEILLLREVEDGVHVAVIDGDKPGANGLQVIQPEDFLFVRRTGAGRFRDEVLPILQGVSSSLSSTASLILIEDRIDD